MKRSYGLWYLVIFAATVTPVALRVMTWSKPRQHREEMSMVKQGEILFNHEWKVNDPLANGGDGLGPVFNANSCAKCHRDPSNGGSGGLEFNVTTFTVRETVPGQQPREGVVHSHAIDDKFRETMAHVASGLPNVSQPSLAQIVNLITTSHSSSCIPTPRGVHFSQRNTPALWGAKLIDEIPDRDIIANERLQRLKYGMAEAKGEDLPVGRAFRFADGRVGRFGWKAQSASLSDFVQAACANELGLGNPGQKQPRSLAKPDYVPTGLDLTQEQCDSITAFVAALPRPIERPKDETERGKSILGKKLFLGIGCADCHTPKLGDVDGLYSDLLLHRMGQPLEGGGSYNDPPVPIPDTKPGEGPGPGEWRTPPLWGVADSAPYLHDGRAATLEEALTLHGGQGKGASQKFTHLPQGEREQLIAFLKTLRAPEASK